MINYKAAVGPFSHSENSSIRIMYTVILTLLPAVLFGVYQFGQNSALIILTCCIVAVGVEYLCLLTMKRDPKACLDGSALLTGLLLAMSLPPTVPMWIAVSGAVFAIVVGKQIYGGLGQNLFNPAMLARVMLLICFPVEMTNWAQPSPIDFSNNLVHIPDEWFSADGVTSATWLGESGNSGYLQDSFFGMQAGSIGETSAFLLLVGGLILIKKGIISWVIPVTFFMGLGIPAALSYWVNSEQFLPLTTHLFSGAAILGAFYIATDLVTSPTSTKGQVLYGLGCGLLIWLIRTFASYPEGVAFAILIMNAASPLIDHYLRPALFGSHEAKILEEKQ
ncbi:RnfABCDGE type electron transport complex subunit D [Vibrio sp. 10N.286.49.B3]|uniref:RnfABCDGE type electron transport complex subunit D n=1 Tax=Vibrio sp. 10N.286.49.B3 TaxID=1880855 RepID=UPI000C828E49|nr:RnfABCDGE type electron transport complex subunit D [Vibrio sp. 10N.286.49.B3]PMH44864.1 RnfABCDGE type electron transport complex subunit D [Vibrio sp. 10N.286.49.B3]